ncbi:nuclear transport factor 2 family protein [Actinomadura sp. 1N219]|uniref:nuclear transport factor 2 family protein n=1 Tax=Actinomadura sp. 1N219 TaxID=3375152 RepID=UPI0037A5D481
MTVTDQPRTLSDLLWTYAYAYTAAHDFSVSDRIMADDYVLRMGTSVLRGRQEEYQRAAKRQYRQYPTLGFTVHRLVTNGDRAALHFTEHGRSIHDGRAAAWQGVSLYRWNGEVLTECRVEQDYYSRKQQLASGIAAAIDPPGIDPWSIEVVAPRPDAEWRVAGWIESGRWLDGSGPRWDDGTSRAQWDRARAEILDLFSAGRTVAFHAMIQGTYTGGLTGSDQWIGRSAELFVTGVVDVNEQLTGQLVSDRHSMLRRMQELT